jgi:ABC-2 type transport system permease protein
MVPAVKAMMLKEFRELARDRRTMAMLIVLPVLLLVVFAYAANFTVSSFRTYVVGPQATAMAAKLPPAFEVVSVQPASGTSQAHTVLRDGKAAVVFDTTTTPPTVWVDGADLLTAQSALAELGRAGLPVMPKVLFNPELKTSWYMVPALIGLILAFLGTIITTIGLVREREAGTLEQLAVMPFRPSDVILGKIAPYFVLNAVDLVIVVVLGIVLFGVPFVGSVAVFAVGAVFFLFGVLGMGVLISTISQTQGQAIQLAILVLLPQILLSGMLFPLAAMPWGVRWIGYVTPLSYFIGLSRAVMLRGAPITAASVWVPVVVLVGMAAVIFGLAVWRFRAQLAPTRSAKRGAARPADTGAAAVA